MLAYDLRHDPTPFAAMTSAELAEAWRWKRDDTSPRLPIKTLQYNRCPAVAPLQVLDEKSAERLKLSKETVKTNLQKLKSVDLVPKVLEALELLDQQQQTSFLQNELEVDARLYDNFIGDADKTNCRVIRAADVAELSNLSLEFKDDRLEALLPLYKARNYPKSLSDEERLAWEKFRERKLLGGKQNSRLARFFNRLAELATRNDLSSKDQYLLEELQLYGQSIMPVDVDY